MARKKVTEETKVDNNIEEIKEELNKYIDDKIKKEFTAELERSHKRLLREKNIKILTKNIIITFLLLIIVYLVYVLNDNDYFDKFFVETDNTKETTNKDNKTTNEEELSLNDLKEEYSYLLDNIYINEESSYLEDYYDGNLTSELKNYLTLNTFNIKDLTQEDNYHIISEKEFKKQYSKLFNSEYSNKTFKYNDNTIRYITKLDSYISDKLIEKNDTNILREIISIVVDDKVTITTVEGLYKDDKLYNILTEEEVVDSDNNILEYQDELTTVKYIFDNKDKLLKIEK